MSSSRTRRVVLCAAVILFAGCDGGEPADAPGSARPPTTPPKSATLAPPEMVAAVSSTRNAGVVSVYFALNGTPTVGKALPMDVAVVPHKPVVSLNVHFEARDGLAIATGNVLEARPDPRQEESIKHQLVLLPNREGVFIVTAVVETVTADGSISRVFAIPVIVAPPAPAPAPAPAAGETQPTEGAPPAASPTKTPSPPAPAGG